ncbi:amino acid ABC transporter membrane protein, PAAT family [Clostridium cavendishii DSM 21758]|uniref:Amino acid ABC transporter membrane protein, PAAT family n=1 Tax=Clostridium cavendishii DSM 21758 TaxID=1121302 RepID=A0A1M6NSW8_9CLOT|nr:amino acid ABC transporter permease [Clostridium cavendishii]SHJ98809.1 amino acid ABC transporter membrane protein, PAAT family [Clostridium cavendishii DSM 21758]
MKEIINLAPQLLDGLKVTLEVFLITLAISIPLGILVAMGRLSTVFIVNKITNIYILIMRGTPLLLQLVFIFFGLPIIGITFDRFEAVIIAFALNYAAYFGEIFRAGIESIDKGQEEAGQVLGLSKSKIFICIIFPQAVKCIIPAMANEVITLVKDTALVYVVGLDELLRVGKIASNREASLIPLVETGIIYLLIIFVLTKLLERVEKRFSYY